MELVPKAEFSIVTRASSKAWIPELIAAAGPEVTESYIDFFTATIRIRNTRQAYARACWQFFDWCAAHDLELTTVRPFHVSAWIEGGCDSEAGKGSGFSDPVGCHTWRATGITIYLENDGRLEHAQQMAGHESPRTTKLYDRTKDAITLSEVERIRL